MNLEERRDLEEETMDCDKLFFFLTIGLIIGVLFFGFPSFRLFVFNLRSAKLKKKGYKLCVEKIKCQHCGVYLVYRRLARKNGVGYKVFDILFEYKCCNPFCKCRHGWIESGGSTENEDKIYDS
ncbi:MAG: hypothetical protein AAB740_01765, partial [Patescibacteria group bacterium]